MKEAVLIVRCFAVAYAAWLALRITDTHPLISAFLLVFAFLYFIGTARMVWR